MRTAFVVMQCYHDYDESSSFPILTTPYFLVAERFKMEMEKRLVIRNASQDTIDQHMASCDSTNPRPRFATYREKPLPFFGPKKSKWTPEQRAEYNAVRQLNRDGSLEKGKPMQDWAIARYEELKRFTATFPQQVQDDLKNFFKESLWEIEEVPYAE